MNRLEIIKLIDDGGQLDKLCDMTEFVPETTGSASMDLLFANKVWIVGTDFREYALALLSRVAVEETFKKEIMLIGVCPVCQVRYEDIEVVPPPIRCDCGLRFSEVPLQTRKVHRYASWEEIEERLKEYGISHGTISGRVQQYKRFINGLDFTWQEAYDSIKSSPTYCQITTEPLRFDRHGNLVDVPQDIRLPGLDLTTEKSRTERVRLTKPILADKIKGDTAVIADSGAYVKSSMIQEARELAGKPTVNIYFGEPYTPLELPMVITFPSEDMNIVESDVCIRFYNSDGERLNKFDADILDSIYETIRARKPNMAMQRRFGWRS